MDPVVAILLAGLWIGLSKGGLGGPIAGALVLPMLSQIMPVPMAVGLILPLLLLGDVFAMWAYWRVWDLHYFRLMMPFAIVGIVLGTVLLATLPDLVLRRVLGLFTLGIVVYKLSSDSLKRVEYRPRNWHGYLAGWAAGFASALANLGGPPVTAYLLLQKLSPSVFIGTITLFFFVVNLIKLPGYLGANIIDLEQLLAIAWMLPVIPVGVWVGRAVVRRINNRLFEWSMMIVLVWAGISLLLSSPPV
jgi:uncharacterized protein